MQETSLFVFGMGYSALAIAAQASHAGYTIRGSSRRPEQREKGAQLGFTLYDFADPAISSAMANASHLLIACPPTQEGIEPVLQKWRATLNKSPFLRWIGYLSTTAVYGDCQGHWVDEQSPLQGAERRMQQRLAAERQWRHYATQKQLPLHIFRLAGIYGPQRNVLTRIKQQRTPAIWKPGHFFSRIHVADIATVVVAAMGSTLPTTVFNVCDDEPANNRDVMRYAARLLRLRPPPEIAFEDATLSPMARSFYAANRRVRNKRIKDLLGIRLAYPSYREGLQALLVDEFANR